MSAAERKADILLEPGNVCKCDVCFGSQTGRRVGSVGKVLRTTDFAPSFGPPDLVRGAGGFHNDPLIGGTERSLEAGQRGFDEPRFDNDPYGLAVGIELPGHPQR